MLQPPSDAHAYGPGPVGLSVGVGVGTAAENPALSPADVVV